MARIELACVTCGHVGPPKRQTPGSFLIELVLWCALIVPGLIYSLWRLSARKNVCAVCGGVALVPPESPKGRQVAAGKL